MPILRTDRLNKISVSLIDTFLDTVWSPQNKHVFYNIIYEIIYTFIIIYF